MVLFAQTCLHEGGWFWNQSTVSSPDWLNTLRKYFHTKKYPSSLGSSTSILTEYSACYSKMRRAMDKLFEDVMLVQSSFPFRWSEGPKYTLHRCSYTGRKLPRQTGHCLPRQQWKSSRFCPVKNGKKSSVKLQRIEKNGLNLASNVVNILFLTEYIIKLYSEINCGLWPSSTLNRMTDTCIR